VVEPADHNFLLTDQVSLVQPAATSVDAHRGRNRTHFWAAYSIGDGDFERAPREHPASGKDSGGRAYAPSYRTGGHDESECRIGLTAVTFRRDSLLLLLLVQSGHDFAVAA
jgi:hypothetical protein